MMRLSQLTSRNGLIAIHDALATDSDELHNASLNAFNLNFGDVQTVDEAIASLKRGLAEKAA